MSELVRARPLPATKEAFDAARILKARPTIIDLVEPIVSALWDNEQFRSLVEAVEDGDTVEGDIFTDHTKAAEMIRDHAQAHQNMEVAKKKLRTLRYAMRRVLTRHNQSIKQRTHGEAENNAPPENDAPAAE